MKKKILNMACWNNTYGTHFFDLYPPKDRPEVKKWDLNKEGKLPYKNNYFDEVLCKGFLEHSVNVGLLISESKRVLKKGGILNIATDNANYWVFSMENSLHRWANLREDGFDDDKHYSLFTDRHLSNLLNYYGFEIISLEYIFHNEISKSRLNQLAKRVVNSFLLFTPLHRMAYTYLKISGKKK